MQRDQQELAVEHAADHVVSSIVKSYQDYRKTVLIPTIQEWLEDLLDNYSADNRIKVKEQVYDKDGKLNVQYLKTKHGMNLLSPGELEGEEAWKTLWDVHPELSKAIEQLKQFDDFIKTLESQKKSIVKLIEHRGQLDEEASNIIDINRKISLSSLLAIAAPKATAIVKDAKILMTRALAPPLVHQIVLESPSPKADESHPSEPEPSSRGPSKTS